MNQHLICNYYVQAVFCSQLCVNDASDSVAWWGEQHRVREACTTHAHPQKQHIPDQKVSLGLDSSARVEITNVQSFLFLPGRQRRLLSFPGLGSLVPKQLWAQLWAPLELRVQECSCH